MNALNFLGKSCYLLKGPLSVEALLRLSNTRDSNCGARQVFTGIIRRDLKKETATAWIEYDVYPPMAEKVMEQIRTEIMEAHDIHSLVMYHSVGKVLPGQASMLVIVNSVHRREAFQACEEAVERIKHEAPVWKKEMYEDGTHEWVNCTHEHSMHQK